MFDSFYYIIIIFGVDLQEPPQQAGNVAVLCQNTNNEKSINEKIYKPF